MAHSKLYGGSVDKVSIYFLFNESIWNHFLFNFRTGFYQLVKREEHSFVWNVDAAGLRNRPDCQTFSYTADHAFDTEWEFSFIPGENVVDLELGVKLLKYCRRDPLFAKVYISVVEREEGMWESGKGIFFIHSFL